MSLRITIRAGKVEFDAELTDSPVTTQLDRWLPFQGICRLWGEDLNFDLPGPVNLVDPALTMEVGRGDVAYSPNDGTLRIYFGRTPFSSMENPMPHRAIVRVGRVIGDHQVLHEIEEGARLEIVRATRVAG